MRVDIACGGTGGHVLPGLAVADELKKRGHDVELWLSGRDVENEVVRGRPEPVHTLQAVGLPSGHGPRMWWAGLRLVITVFESRRQMRQNRPDAVLGMGSYASVGPCLAARSLGIPFVLHEANAIPGRAVALLSRFATAVAVSFPQTCSRFKKCRVVHTGFPVRRDLEGRFEDGVLRPGLFTVLIMGGSQGAARLNETGGRAICLLHRKGMNVQVVHLTGRGREGPVEAVYSETGVPHVVIGFLKEMGKAYHAARLAVSRAGAASLMELASCGVPAVLVPYPHAAHNHQMENALALRSLGAAEVIPEAELTIERLAERIEGCIRRPERLDSMRLALKNIVVPNAAERIAELVEYVGSGAQRRR